MSVAAIRQGLAANLANLPETQVLAYITANPVAPTVWVATCRIEPLAMGSRRSGKKYTDQYTATVQAMTDFTEPQGAQQQLDQYMAGSGAYSVSAAIQADPTLAGVADSLVVESWEGPTLSTFQTFSLLLAEWTVRIIATEVAL